MLAEIDELLRRNGGVARRSTALTVMTRTQLDHEVRSGRLVVPFPRTVCRPWDEDAVRERAALLSVGAPVALSHLTALRRWVLLASGSDDDIHVSVPAERRVSGRARLIVHRVARRPPHVVLDGLPTVHPADAVVSSWPLLAPDERRAPAIAAVRKRLISAQHLSEALAAHPRLAGRRQLAELVTLLADGCESELEIWGYLNVFDVPGLRHGKRQHWVHTPAGNFRVDLGYEEERVAVELDGARFHSSREQRERDMRRDAAFATIGWLTLRFSHERLHLDVPGCRRDTLAALEARRR